MRTDAVLLLTQWLSSNFPVGAFAYSSGLEAAIAGGCVGPDTLEAWLGDILERGSGYSDGVLIRAAAQGDPGHVNEVARSLCPSHERLIEAETQGAAFCAQMRSNWDIETGDLLYPVAFGLAVSHQKLPIELAVQMYLQAWTGNLVAAAQRLMPLGQTRAQEILRNLSQRCTAVADASAGKTLDDLTSHSFMADIASMKHETLSPRIFRT